MKIRYGKWILTKPDQVLKQLTDKDAELALAVERRFKTAAYADTLAARHQPYSSGNHNGNHDLSATPTEQLAEALAKRVAGNLFCTSCRTQWPCKDLGPLRALARELRYPSDEPLPPIQARSTDTKNTIGVTL